MLIIDSISYWIRSYNIPVDKTEYYNQELNKVQQYSCDPNGTSYVYLLPSANKYELGLLKAGDVDKIITNKGIEMDVPCYGISSGYFFFTAIVYRAGSLHTFHCGQQSAPRCSGGGITRVF